MIRIAIFNLILILVTGYALKRGGAPERVVAAAMLAAAVATALVSFATRANFQAVVLLVLLIDVLLLLAVGTVAVFANRYWPLWIAALQLDAIAIHIIRAYDRGLLPLVYAWSSGQIAYPMLVLLAWGTLRHQRRVRATGAEPGWSR